MEKETIREIAYIAWRGAADAIRMYPENKHTFSAYWAVAESMFTKYESPLPNGLPDENEMLDMLAEYTTEVENAGNIGDKGRIQIKHANLILNKMRSLAQKALDEKLECDHRYYSRTGRYMLYEDWCEKCGNYCHEV